MKKILFFLLVISANTSFASTEFTPWCNAFTAQGMISLTANRIFGSISSLSDEQYKARKQWIKNAMDINISKFKSETGKGYYSFENANNPSWIARCQLKDQI